MADLSVYWQSITSTPQTARKTLLTDINNAGGIDGYSSAVFRGRNLQ
jgi:hypothetical protein